MPIEIELKFRIEDPAGLRRRLRQLDFRAGARRREQNWIFDDARGRLRAAGQLLRLRRAGPRWWLTAKGKRQPGALKRRQERETELVAGAGCRRLLELLGYRVQLRYARWRTVFRRRSEPGEVDWDVTPFGIYLELEGSASWVRRTARELGLEVAAAEPRAYPELYRDAARTRLNARRRTGRKRKAPERRAGAGRRPTGRGGGPGGSGTSRGKR